jgi:hypothetical protein
VEDERLLLRLEDEVVVEKLFAAMSSAVPRGRPSPGLHARAAGLVAEVRKLEGGADVVAAAMAGDVSRLARWIEALPIKDAPPALLHHLALFHIKIAAALELDAPELAASQWVRSLAAWLALAEERTYLSKLAEAIVGADARRGLTTASAEDVATSPERGPHELLDVLARRATDSARELGAAGKTALLALARTDEAVALAGVPPAVGHRLRGQAERRRNAAIEAALAVIGEALDDANVRGELASSGRSLLYRAVPVWTWTSNDEAVEHFVVDRVDKIGWELYRARSWDALRYLLDPFRPIFESLARRIEQDPTQISYAATCAQMYVFCAEVEGRPLQKIELAERALKICPIHRNGRLVLASALCDQAMDTMKNMALFARREEVRRVESLLQRVESLYPDTRALPDAKTMLARVKTGRITV